LRNRDHAPRANLTVRIILMNVTTVDDRARAIAATIVALFRSGFAPAGRSSADRNLPVAVEAVAAAPADAGTRLAALFPEERQHVQRAVRKRQAEFAAGRICARRALARLGIPPAPLLVDPDRAPCWPPGIVGSISHAEGICAAVVARAAHVTAIGLDLEGAAPLDSDLERLVATPQERRLLDGRAHLERGHTFKLLFSGKEAFYKCQHPRTRTFLDFQDVELDLDPSTGTFSPRLVNPVHRALTHLQAARGRWRWHQDLLITTCWLLA
jgi:4'-phosphopantetheinyl transferase EntD